MKTIILLHGALGASSVFDKLTPALPKEYKVFTLNLSGHGDTPFNQGGFGIEVFAQELNAFIKDNGLAKPEIFGYSMGGYVALYLEYLHPGTFSRITTLGTKFAWSPEAAQHEVKRLVPEVIEQKVPAFAVMLAKRHQDWKTLMKSTADMMLGLGDTPLLTRERLNSINIPVLVTRGDQDQMVTEEESEDAANAMAKGVYQVLENTPHPIEKVDVQVLTKLITNI